MHFPATRAAAARTRRLSGPPTILGTRTGIVVSTRFCLRNRRRVGLGSLRGSSGGLVSRPKLAFPSPAFWDQGQRVTGAERNNSAPPATSEPCQEQKLDRIPRCSPSISV